MKKHEKFFTLPGIGERSAVNPHIKTPDPIQQAIEELQSADYTFVKWHGAVGDGITDDTDAIRRAFVSGKSNIFFDPGTYKITEPIILPSYTRIVGFNAGIHFYRPDDEPAGGWNLNDDTIYALYKQHICFKTAENASGYSGSCHITIEGLSFFDPDSAYNTLILLQHSSDIVIQNCRFGAHNGWHFIEVNSSEKVSIKNNTFSNYPFNEYAFNNATEMIQLDGAYSTGMYNGRAASPGCEPFDDTQCKDVVIEGNFFANSYNSWVNATRNQSAYPVGIGSHTESPAHPHFNIVIKNNTFEYLVYAVLSCNMVDSVISGNTIKRCAGGIRFYNGTGSSNVVDENTIDLSQVFTDPDSRPDLALWQAYQGISFEDSVASPRPSEVIIANNIIYSRNSQAIAVNGKKFVISGNVITAWYREGIYFYQSSYSIANGNFITCTTTYLNRTSIRIHPTSSTANSVFNNVMVANSGHYILDNGTATLLNSNREITL